MFTATPYANHTAQLNWATATEINNSHFDIERSYNGTDFTLINRVDGNGNSNEVIHYKYLDGTIAKTEKVAYYRLNQFDYDGASEYSEVRKVDFDGENELDASDIRVYPNPFTGDLYVDMDELSGDIDIQILDMNGRVLLSPSATGNGIQKLDMSSLSTGIYIISITSEHRVQQVRVMKK